MIKFLLIPLTLLTFSTSCSLKRDTQNQPKSDQPSGQSEPQIKEEDWDVTQSNANGFSLVRKELKPKKLQSIREAFKAPSLYALTLPEANGFEIYYAKGFVPLENTAFIHPKLFLSSGTDRGSILGYKTGEKDESGHDLVAISIPVALVNGLVPSLPLIGGAGSSAAIRLPEKYVIPDKDALLQKVNPKSLDTLPVCPKVFRLTFQGREYRAESPFRNLSTCPLNQFFRIKFKAPVDEMRQLLEAAALQDEAVTLVTDLTVDLATPKTSVEITMDRVAFARILKHKISEIEPGAVTANGSNGYALETIEDVVIDSLFTLIRENGISPEFSPGMPRIASELIDAYFDLPFTCRKGGICRPLKSKPALFTDIRYAWTVAEPLSAPIETQQVVGLGAVANTSAFLAKPSWSVLEYGQKPKWFSGKSVESILSECEALNKANYPTLPGMDPAELSYIQGYCNGVMANASRNANDPEETDGYYPLGANTTVYPGAWLRIDLDEISEFTTAKTKVDKEGNTIIESDVVDLLSSDPSAKRTSCVEGSQTACETYALKEIPVRTSTGDQVISDQPCARGETGCTCTKLEDGSEKCSKKQLQFQKVMDYECDAKDTYEVCPYYRNQEDIIEYEKEWDCQLVKVEDRTSFLCFGGCSQRYETQCNIKSQKPIKAIRQYLNCQEDDPKGTARREIMCRRPQYLCEKWATRCSRYSVNEAFQIVHENVAPAWRPFALLKGEYPKRFEDQLYLKFVSPKGTVSECRLDKFGRFFRGNTLFIKIPTAKNEELPCGVSLWNSENSKPLFLPKVYIKNSIAYSEMRLCGRTEYSFLTEEVPASNGKSIVPSQFKQNTKVKIGPVTNSCRAPNPVPIGSDNWFSEVPPIRVSGRVSVLGRVLESIVTGDQQ